MKYKVPSQSTNSGPVAVEANKGYGHFKNTVLFSRFIQFIGDQ